MSLASALSLAWNSSTMLSMSPVMAPPSAAVKFHRKGFELATKPSPDHHNSRIQAVCENAVSVAVSTSKSTSVSGSSGNILLNNLRGNSSTLDITGLECFDIISPTRQILLKLEKVKASLQERLGREPTAAEWSKAAGIDKTSLDSRLKGGLISKDRMMKSNIRLVVSIAKLYKGCGITLPHLIQVGNQGLMLGIEKFDYKKGFRFSTYAHWWIRHSITKFVNYHSRSFRMPVSMREIFFRVKAAKKLLSGEDGRLTSIEEVAELVGVAVPRVRRTMKSSRRPRSIDQPAGKGFETTLGEVAAQMDTGRPEESTISRKILKQEIDNLFRKLTPKQRQILCLRQGLIDGRPKTLDEVGVVFDISRERIRQLELEAWTKLKKQRVKSLRRNVDCSLGV